MPKKVRRRKKQQQNPFLSIGFGLFLVGMAVVLFASGNSNNSPGSGAAEFSVLPIEVNFPAPELSLENIDGRTESLADYRDGVVLVNNWATWCPPCKAEMPTLEAYFEEHAGEGFSIIAIEAGDSRELVSHFAEQYQLQFPVWLDPAGASLRAFGNGTLPNSYVIDRTGTVRLAWTGEVNRDVLEKYVTPLLTEQ